MRNRDPDPKLVRIDAEKVQQKFGGCSRMYAEERSEAAEVAGDANDARHWKEVADRLERNGGQ